MMQMADASDRTLRRIAAGGRSVAVQLRSLISRIIDRQWVARALFWGDDGKLKPEAEEWFAELAVRNYVHGGAFHVDRAEHCRREGRRELALEIIESAGLDTIRLGQLRDQLRKEEQGHGRA